MTTIIEWTYSVLAVNGTGLEKKKKQNRTKERGTDQEKPLMEWPLIVY